MFKKVGHIFIIILLLFGTAGITITKHYCGSHLIQTAVFSIPENCCSGNCPGCHNEKISLDITDQYESTQTHLVFIAGFKTLLENNSLPTLLAFSNVSEISLFNDRSGGKHLKPVSTKSISAGPSTPFLQVFLF